MSDIKNIILTILVPASIFLFAQTGISDSALSADFLSAIQTKESCAIILYSIWSLVICMGGMYFFIDRQTLGLKESVAKNTFAVYIAFILLILASTILLKYLLTGSPCF